MFAATAPAPRASVLVISADAADCSQLRSMLPPGVWEVVHASEWVQACELLAERTFSVVVADSESANLNWKELIGLLDRAPNDRPPRLVIASSTADDYLWSEVLNLGGYNVLAKPFHPQEVAWVLHNAHADWEQAPAAVAGAC